MKKKWMFFILALSTVLVVKAQKLSFAKVPTNVKNAFEKHHPSITAKWEKENTKFEAAYKENGHIFSELFEADGTMTESEITIKTIELPIAVTEYVKTHYKGANIREAAKITNANGSVTYEAAINKMDLIFDAAGKFIKETKD